MKCNTTFEDGTNFCPKCGSKLVDVDVCPQCGSPISKEDVFCKKCGHRLKEEVKKEEPAPVAAKAPEEPKERSEKPLQIMNMVICGVLFLVILFLFIGVWGDMYQLYSSTLGMRATIGINYFVHDQPQAIAQYAQASWANDSFMTYTILCFVVESFLYYSGIILCVTFSIISLVKNIKAISNKTEPNLKFPFIAGASMLPIMLLNFAKYNGSSTIPTYNIVSSFGWGGGLIIAALTILLTCHMTLKIFEACYKKENIAPTIIRSVTALVIFILMFNIFGPLTSMNVTGYGEIAVNGYAFGEASLHAYSLNMGTSTYLYAIFMDGIFSLLFSIAGLLMIFFAYRLTLKGNKASPIVMSGLCMLFLIIAAVFSTVGTEEFMYRMYGISSNVRYGFASGPIAGIIMLNIVMASLIVSAALTKKKEA